jgi:hypothetical protein
MAMKTLSYNFSHPVKGVIRFLNKLNPAQKHARQFDSESGLGDICIDDLPAGKWSASIEWEYDGKDYLYTEEFEIGCE